MENNEETLAAELKKARLTIKKLERELKLANTAIERNKTSAEAKDKLSKIIEEKKSELEMYMNLLLENCPDIIMLFNKDGRIAYCTEAFLKIAGIAGFGMIADKHYRDILWKFGGQNLQDQDKAIYEQIKRTGKFAPITLHQTIDFSGRGNPRDYTIQVSPMEDEQGNNRGAMILFYDVTELLAARRDAEKANKAKSDFLATVSHEIRTPMNAIIGIAAILEHTELTEEQRNYLKKIQNSSSILLGLINDVLDFSKIEAGKLEIVNEYFSLNRLLEHLREIFELLFPEKDLEFRCAFSSGLPEVVYGDEKRIGQIITNLLNNSYKYTRQGGAVLRVDAAPAGEEPGEAGASSDTAVLRFTVEDTGIGIKEEALPRLFSAFEQLDQVRNKRVQGTGLGLTITKRLCDLMNGSITVSSVYNSGSVFTVTLPLKAGKPEDLPADERVITSFAAKGVKALLVDDIDINLEIAAFMLNSFGINPDTAKSGSESIEKAKSTEYDIIFMDHMMPEMDGVEAVKLIRSEGAYNAGTPIIALTANAVSGAREMFLQNSFNDLLSKPLEITALAEILLRWLPEELIRRNISAADRP
ncbi:MAG: response regulator [Spirochaetaceae bacterium]|jgi:PAS domain S-box-containing protein|nr:response regulator [Spirochaetaceae bacterium]